MLQSKTACCEEREMHTKQFQHLQIIIIMCCYFSFLHIHHLQARLSERRICEEEEEREALELVRNFSLAPFPSLLHFK